MNYSNIDVRIRQAELEYALGREELQLLSISEQTRELQVRLDKLMKADCARKQMSLYYQLHKSFMYLCAVNANLGRFGLNFEGDGNGVYVDWVSDGELLIRGDRIIECNGQFLDSQSMEEFRDLLASNGKCELVVIRKRASQINHQILLQSQEDNQRLQHRISYLEDQVKELQHSTKEMKNLPTQSTTIETNQSNLKGDHVTNISISSSGSHDNEKPQIFQRGNFVATIIGGKAVQTSSSHISASPASKVDASALNIKPISKLSIDKSNKYPKSEHDMNFPSQRSILHSQSHQQIGSNNKIFDSTSKIAIRNDSSSSQSFLKFKEKNRDQYKENYSSRGHSDRHSSHPDLLSESVRFYFFIAFKLSTN